jgi:hypothetical protein
MGRQCPTKKSPLNTQDKPATKKSPPKKTSFNLPPEQQQVQPIT